MAVRIKPGQSLLGGSELCGQLLTLMAGMDQVDGKVKPWRDVLKARENIDWSSAAPAPRATGNTTVVANQPYAEECEDHVSDDDVSARVSSRFEPCAHHKSANFAHGSSPNG